MNSQQLRKRYFEQLETRDLLTALSFLPHSVIGRPDISIGKHVVLTDLDVDGDLDALVASNHGEIKVFHNTDGMGKLEPSTPIAVNLRLGLVTEITEIVPADMDGDGDSDLIVSQSWGLFGSELVWLENLDGTGTFGMPRELHTGAGYDFDLEDVNGDGNPDVTIVSQMTRDRFLQQYVNTGNEFQSYSIPSDPNTEHVRVGDLTGDGRRDLVITTWQWSSNEGAILLYENLGDGTEYASPIQISTLEGRSDLELIDLDSDGDLDVIVDGAWYENSNSSFEKRNSIALPEHFVDWDQDADVDALTIVNDKLVWLENDGKGNFGSNVELGDVGIWESLYSGLYTGDLDSDGQLDVVTLSWCRSCDNSLRWFPVVDGKLGVSREIGESSFQDPTHLIPADIDGDGDTDFFSTGTVDGWPDSLVWAENADGKGTFGEPSLIGYQLFAPLVVDINNDGLPDIADGDRWFLNNGGQFVERDPSEEVPGNGPIFWADMDGDGDQDLLITSADRSTSRWRLQLVWYENTEGQFSTETRYVIAEKRIYSWSSNTPFEILRSVSVADLDNDSAPDVLIHDGEKLVWYENLQASEEFGPEKHIADGSFVFEVIDFDSDGDSDILTKNGNELGWYENTGAGVFGSVLTSIPIEAGKRIAEVSPVVNDLDGDGDYDVMLALDGTTFQNPGSRLVWYENLDGLGTFGTASEIATTEWGISSLDVADVDDDGDLDIYAANSLLDKTEWFENRLTGDANDNGSVDFADFLALSANFGLSDAVWADGDFNADGTVSFDDFLFLSANFGTRRT